MEIVDNNLNAAKYSIFLKFAESCIAAKSKQHKKRQEKAAGKISGKSARQKQNAIQIINNSKLMNT